MAIRRILDATRSADFTHRVGIILILLMAFVLRVALLDKFGLWDGELHTVFHALRPLADFPAAFRVFAAHPPLWYVLVHFLLLAEPSVWILRVPSVLVGTASVAAGYVLARRFLPGHWALVSMLLFAISPISLRWSQSVRMYAAFILLSTISFYFVLRLLDARHKLAWLGFALITLMNLYMHYFAAFPLIAEALWLALVLVWSFRSQASGVRNHWLVVRRALLAAVIIAVGYLPWFWSVGRFNFIERQTLREEAQGRDTVTLQLFYRLFEDLLGSTAWLTTVLILLALLGFLHLLRHRHYRHSALIALSILAPVAVIIGFGPRRFHAKYVAYGMPLLVILVVAGIAELRDLVLRLIKRKPEWAVVSSGVLVGAIALASAPNLLMDYHYYRGDPEVYQQSTEPNVWLRRGEWPQFMQHIANGDGGFLFHSCPPKNDCPSLARQVAINTYLSPNAVERLLDTDWTTEDEFDVWWIFQHTDADVVVKTLDEVILGQQVMTDANYQLWRAHLRANYAEDILPNGSFETPSTPASDNDETVAMGWHVNRRRQANFEIVNNPTIDGAKALLVTPEKKPATLQSDPIPIQPGVLLHGSMQVRNLTLKMHDTSPNLILNFEDANHKIVKRKVTVYHYLPYRRDDTGSWQQLTVQAIAPEEARYVVLSIEFGLKSKYSELYPIEDRQPAIVDDVRLIAITWEPAP